MGLIKDRHGTYYAQQKVPERLQAAVARYLGNGKPKQVYQKKSLGTKDLRTANVRAKPVLAGFDRVLREAAALQVPKSIPTLRSSLNAAEIARMSEALYGKLLADDEASRFGGRARVVEVVEWIRRNENPDFQLPYPIESVREHGWHPEVLAIQREHMVHELATMQEALALGDITAVEDDVALLLADFEINLDRKSVAYRELGTQALRAYVRALQAIDKRNAGEPIETPKFTRGSQNEQATLFAHCASSAVNALHEPANRYNEGRVSAHGVRRRLDQADVLARAVGLDMAAAGWKPTVDNYLGRVTKPRILDAVREAKGEKSVQLIDHLKKGDMAREAERLLDGTGWLPEPLRLVEVDTAGQDAGGEAEALPEFLATDEDEAAANAEEEQPHIIAAE